MARYQRLSRALRTMGDLCRSHRIQGYLDRSQTDQGANAPRKGHIYRGAADVCGNMSANGRNRFPSGPKIGSCNSTCFQSCSKEVQNVAGSLLPSS